MIDYGNLKKKTHTHTQLRRLMFLIFINLEVFFDGTTSPDLKFYMNQGIEIRVRTLFSHKKESNDYRLLRCNDELLKE